jgi:hypothetical protein
MRYSVRILLAQVAAEQDMDGEWFEASVDGRDLSQEEMALPLTDFHNKNIVFRPKRRTCFVKDLLP